MKDRPPLPRMLDGRVVKTMIVFGVIGVLILSFRAITHQACNPVKIQIEEGRFYRGQYVRFKLVGHNLATRPIQWSINDNSKSKSGLALQIIEHQFKRAGTYDVSVLIGSKCKTSAKITIYEAPATLFQVQFAIPDSGTVGTPVICADSTPGATEWEWRFNEPETQSATSNHVQHTRIAQHTFQTSGQCWVSLRVRINGRDTTVGKSVRIFENNVSARRPTAPLRRPLPPPPLIVRPPADPITKRQMEERLFQVIKGQLMDRDFLRYVNSLNMPVRLNGELMDFSQMCGKLREFEQKRVDTLIVQELSIKNELGYLLTMNITLSIIQAPKFSVDQIANALKDVVEGRKKASDFEQYLCGSLNIKVLYNGEQMNFTQMCNELARIRRMRNDRRPTILDLRKDEVTGCITYLSVEVQRGLL